MGGTHFHINGFEQILLLKQRQKEIVAVTRVTLIGPLHNPVTWYGINYAGTQKRQWDFQNKGTLTSPA